MDLFSTRHDSNRSVQANEIKALVAETLGLDEEASVLVFELACKEVVCPPIETVIAIFRPNMEKIQFRLHRPMAEVTEQEIRALCAQQIDTSLEESHGSCCS